MDPDLDKREEWDNAWHPCPDAHPQRVRRALGFWERNVRELELRVPLGGNDGGGYSFVVDKVRVRVLVASTTTASQSRPSGSARTGQSASGSSVRSATER